MSVIISLAESDLQQEPDNLIQARVQSATARKPESADKILSKQQLIHCKLLVLRIISKGNIQIKMTSGSLYSVLLGTSLCSVLLVKNIFTRRSVERIENELLVFLGTKLLICEFTALI